MYQTLDDLANIQNTQTEPSKSRGWIKWFLIGLGLIILVFAVLFIHNRNNEENNSSLSEDDIDSDFLDGNVDLEDGNIFSRLLQIDDEESDEKDIQSKNAEILSQIKDPQFWSGVIEDKIKDSGENWGREYKKENTEVIGYGLYCKGYEKDLSKCSYLVSFIEKDENRSYYSNGGCGSPVKYHCIKKGIVMNDIGNGNVFYDIYDWRTDNEDEIIQKYLGKYFESRYEGDYREIDAFRLLTNNDNGTSNYYLYIVDGNTGEILYKNSEKIISKDNAKKIIAENAGIGVNNVKYLDLEKNNLIYESNFSYNGRMYDFKIDAKDGTIINNADEKDIGDEKAMEIALKDSGLKATDLREDVSHGHGMEKILLIPKVTREGTGLNSIYNVEIETEDDIVYTYQIRANDGKILLKHLSEQFVIYDKKGAKKNTIYKIKSTHKKSRNLEIKPSELNMDDIYEFKDQIYLWISFDGDKIANWSIIDRPYKHMGKMTKDELDEYYNFESYYPVKTIDKTFSESTELKLSGFEENVLYRIKIGQICRLNIINDTEDDVIVYQGYYGEGRYDTTPYLKEGYAGSRDCISIRGNSDDYYSILYKKASSEDLFKVIDKKEITYLSKFKVGDELNMNQRYDEKYLYNDTNNDLTISVTDYGIVNAPEDFEFVVKPGKLAHCYEYTDVVKIIK